MIFEEAWLLFYRNMFGRTMFPLEMIRITGTTDKYPNPPRHHFALNRTPKIPPLVSTGIQFDLRGFCSVCGVRPDPLKPGICFCNHSSATRARVYMQARTKRNDN